MKIKEIIKALEELAPLALQESYDNAGLLTGSAEWEADKALICLDSTEAVIDEAIAKKCNLVIAHHPIIFSGLKKINGKNYVERTIIKAIKNDIAIYAIHTNLDNVMAGVNQKIADKLALIHTEILSPRKATLHKLITFCPTAEAEKVRLALFEAGGGHIGNYDSCSFNTNGIGTYRGNAHSNPFAGEQGKLHREAEERIELIYPFYLEKNLLHALKRAHPYEEVAYDIIALQNKFEKIGAGMLGELAEAVDVKTFIDKMKTVFKVPVLRCTKPIKHEIKKVALCGGSGSFLINDAISKGADVFISADFKYHQFFDADERLMIIDMGHYESEQFTIELLFDYVQQKFPTFALVFSETNTNPIIYF